MSDKHNHSKYRLCSGKLPTLIRFPEQTLEMDMEKRKRISTLVTDLEIEPICVFQLTVILTYSTDISFASTLSIKKLALFCLRGKDAMFFCKNPSTQTRA